MEIHRLKDWSSILGMLNEYGRLGYQRVFLPDVSRLGSIHANYLGKYLVRLGRHNVSWHGEKRPYLT